ncbi:MAG: CARDB domain-containing protein [Planctomycetota bacterium]
MARKSFVFSLMLIGGQFVSQGQAQQVTLDRPRLESGYSTEPTELRWSAPRVPAAPTPVRQSGHTVPIQVYQADGSIRTVQRPLDESSVAVKRAGGEGVQPGRDTMVKPMAGEAPGSAGDPMPSVLRRKPRGTTETPTDAPADLPAESRADVALDAPLTPPVTAPATPAAPANPAAPALDLTGPASSSASSNPIAVAKRTRGESAMTSPPATILPANQGLAPVVPASQIKGKMMSLRSTGPMLTVEALGPRAVVIGKPAAYAVTVVNSSQMPATNVQVRVQVPVGIEALALRSAVGEVSRLEEGEQAGLVVWNIPEVAGGARTEMVMQLLPRDAQGFDLAIDWTCQPKAAMAAIAVQRPQLDLAITGPKDARFGETVAMLITVSNPGTGDAEDVHVKLQAGQNAPENIPVGLVAAGQQKQIEVQLAANQAGTTSVAVDATGDGDLTANAATELIVRRADLQLAVAAPAQSFSGTPTTFQVRVTNSGNAAADDTLLNVALPAGAKLVATTEGARAANGSLQWRIGAMPAGIERVFEIQCEMSAAGENRLDARVTAATGLNATGNAITEVQALADLKLTVDEPKGPRSVGEEVVYELTIVNRGTKAAEDVNVVVQFSSGVEPLAADGGPAELAAGQVVFEPISRLASGQKTVLKVKARAEKAGSHRFRVQVSCDNSETQLVSEGTSRFFGGAANSARPLANR